MCEQSRKLSAGLRGDDIGMRDHDGIYTQKREHDVVDGEEKNWSEKCRNWHY